MRLVRGFSAAVVVGALCAAVLAPAEAGASSSGRIGGGCTSCHVGGAVPTVTLSPQPSEVLPGQTVTFTVTVSATNGPAAGFNLFGNAGTFSNPGSDVKIVSNQATHSSPKLASGGVVAFTVDWTAPSVTGPVSLTAWGNSVNANGTANGDNAAATMLSLDVCGTTWYADADADGFGGTQTTVACTMPPGHAAAGGDCDDANAQVNPGASEVCNGIDDDCDGTVDDGAAPTTYHADVDADGYGDPATAVSACTAPANHVTNSGDCDDQNATIHPGAAEVCNGVDDDCDGVVDDGIPTSTWYSDGDADGFGAALVTVVACAKPAGYVAGPGDCDDGNAQVNPGAAEVCNGVDDDCDTQVDEGLPQPTFYADLDGDGVGGATSVTACAQPMGHVTVTGDCDDTNAQIHPTAAEVCNGLDDDCDAQVDEGLPQPTFYADADGDGVGGTTTVTACAQPAGHVTITGDCDDADPTVRPGLAESCNGKDEDCDGQIDEAVKTTFYRDQDGDLFGTPGDSTQACALPMGYVANAQDCDDQNGAIHPGAAETCDGVDEDCDGVDDDGVPNATCGLGACQRTGATCHAQSCSPGMGSPETCNGVDDDCNGIVDDDPDALCSGAQTCIAGACVLPTPDSGTDAGTDGGATDAGADAEMDGGDADAGSGETPDAPRGCGCQAPGGGGGWMAFLGAALLAAAVRRRRAHG